MLHSPSWPHSSIQSLLALSVPNALWMLSRSPRWRMVQVVSADSEQCSEVHWVRGLMAVYDSDVLRKQI